VTVALGIAANIVGIAGAIGDSPAPSGIAHILAEIR
jgi:hypothetical protein